jgi:hypothetical protein
MRLRVPVRTIGAEDALHVPDVRVLGEKALDAEVGLHADGVEGLLKLPPPDVADEAVVVKLDALAPGAEVERRARVKERER